MAALVAASVRQKRQQRQQTADANMRALRLQQQQAALFTDSDDLDSRFGGLESRRSSGSWKDYRDGLKEQDVSGHKSKAWVTTM